MKSVKLTAVATIAATVVGLLTIQTLDAQQPGFKRVELQRGDLSVAGREVVVVRGEFEPGAMVGRHSHPGEESTYILEGTVQLEIDGKPPVISKAGDVIFIPAGTIHSAKNIGTTPAKVLANYIVEKGKPLSTPAK